MNREGKSYRSRRVDASNGKDNVNGSLIVVTRSVSWNESLGDKANFTHACLVLECPADPTQVGREVRLDERKYLSGNAGNLVSTWDNDDCYFEV